MKIIDDLYRFVDVDSDLIVSHNSIKDKPYIFEVNTRNQPTRWIEFSEEDFIKFLSSWHI